MQNGNKINENINVVGIKVLEQNGINVNEIIKLLVYNASVEFTAYYYFTNLRMHCTGQEGESIKGVIDAQEFIRMSGCEFLQLPSPKRTDLKEILKKCLKAEQGAIVNWNRLCNLTIGKDPATYDIAKDILKEEIEHESWFLELLYERPSGHMRRKYPGERPHTHKHSRSLNI
jgi:ferritin-like protein